MAEIWRRLGNIPLESPFTLAALAGYSDMGMRVVCRDLGACLTRNEVVLDQFIVDGGRGARSGRFLDDNDHPIALQLMGSDPDTMALAAQKMVGQGYDLIDINFGCPVRKVLGRCRGGFLLGDPDTAISMMQRVRDAVSTPVTIKMRRGRDDSEESNENFWKIVEHAVELGIAGIVVHGRTVEQGYIGPARWDIITEVKQRYPQWLVMGSGDLYTAEDCLRMLRQTGCDGVTLARGAIENPWVFRDCLAAWHGEPPPPPPSLAEQGELFDRQYRLAVIQYGADRASRQMRKFGIKRAALHPLGLVVRDAFVNLSNPADWEAVRNYYYSSSLASEELSAGIHARLS